ASLALPEPLLLPDPDSPALPDCGGTSARCSGFVACAGLLGASTAAGAVGAPALFTWVGLAISAHDWFCACIATAASLSDPVAATSSELGMRSTAPVLSALTLSL